MTYKPLYAYTQTPMTRDTAKVFMAMSMSEHTDNGSAGEQIEELRRFQLFKILESNLKGYEVDDKITGEVLIFLFFLINETNATPAVCRMYAHTLRHMVDECDVEVINLSVLVTRFSNGFPNLKALGEAWDDYKVLMDH